MEDTGDECIVGSDMNVWLVFLFSRFVYLKGCGCVISEKALKEVPSKTCHKV